MKDLRSPWEPTVQPKETPIEEGTRRLYYYYNNSSGCVNILRVTVTASEDDRRREEEGCSGKMEQIQVKSALRGITNGDTFVPHCRRSAI